MKIIKYPHSCLLVEDNGRKLLIDPGGFSFGEKFLPEQAGAVDTIIITHSHPDHLSLENLKKFLNLKQALIIASPYIVGSLEKEGLKGQSLGNGEIREIAGFTIQAFNAPHEPVPFPTPPNFAYLINRRLLHPGDSYAHITIPDLEVLALPTQGPWMRLVDAVEYGLKISPKKVIPIHNALWKPEIGAMFEAGVFQKLRETGIETISLKDGSNIEL